MKRLTSSCICVSAVLLLGACSTVSKIPASQLAKGVISGDITDRVIKRLEGVNDTLFEDIDKAITFAEAKLERLRNLRCKLPYTGLRRYVDDHPEMRGEIKQYCGVDIIPSSAVVQ